MSINLAAQGGEAQIREFTVFSNNNRDVSILSGIIDLIIYQSCLDNSVRVTATFTDTGYRSDSVATSSIEQDDLDLTAGEKVFLQLADGYGNNLVFKDDYHLRIQQLRDIIESSTKNVFTIDLYSLESINNELTDNRVQKRYDGRITDSIRSILTETLKTNKNIFIDPCINNLNFLGNAEKPFYKIPWLAKRSVPDIPGSRGKYAGYFFFETPDDGTGTGGFHFKSIDKFFTQAPKKKLIYNNTPYLPVDYDGKIITYSIDSSVNLDKSLKTGANSNQISKTFNPFTHEYNENVFNNVERMIPTYMGGETIPNIASDLNLTQKGTKVFTKWKTIGVLPSGSTLESQQNYIDKEDWNFDEIVRQAEARYNNLFNTRINIVIPGDFSIKAGDIITCDFPEISSRATKIISNKKSGNYLVIDVAHRVSRENCYTSINLVRESIYKV